jgi:predicted nuclease of predicted toxin-antitoxin system
VRFLVDTQLPAAVTRFLQDQGHQAEHVFDLGLGQSKDNVLWEHAEKNQAVIVTKDEDFADWIARGRPGPSVVWLRIGNCTNTSLLIWLASLWPQILVRLNQGERLVEVRSEIQSIERKNN